MQDDNSNFCPIALSFTLMISLLHLTSISQVPGNKFTKQYCKEAQEVFAFSEEGCIG